MTAAAFPPDDPSHGPGHGPADDFEHMFDLAPVSLWLEDFSGIQRLFSSWRAQGVTDLREHLARDPAQVRACMATLRVLRVNQRTLQMFGAASQDELLARLGEIFRGDMAENMIEELCHLWDGHLGYENQSVNYTLDGQRLDVFIHVRMLPGHETTWARALVSLDDITARLRAERKTAASERYARGLFDQSPISLWAEDFSGVKRLLDGVRAQGVTDFGAHLQREPGFVAECMQAIRVIDVNRETLRMFGAASKEELLGNIGRVFRDEMQASFTEQLHDLWKGKTLQQREVVNYALSGELVHIHMQFAVLESHLAHWDVVLLSLVDITARKKAELYLEYLGRHDVLTELGNRAFYNEEVARLTAEGRWPVSLLAIDMNGLKTLNDEHGHAAGDAMLRRIGEVLRKAVDAPGMAARMGGDEFAVLLPETDERGAEQVRDTILSMQELNNQFHGGLTGHVLSLSIGAATCRAGEDFESVAARADQAMYVHKSHHYRDRPDRRRR